MRSTFSVTGVKGGTCACATEPTASVAAKRAAADTIIDDVFIYPPRVILFLIGLVADQQTRSEHPPSRKLCQRILGTPVRGFDRARRLSEAQ